MFSYEAYERILSKRWRKKTLTKQKIAEATKLKRACGSTFFGGGLGLEPVHVPHKTPNIKIMLRAVNEL